MEIYLIRHTTPKATHGLCYGRSDVSLADSFLEEWKRIQAIIPNVFDVVYSSPAQRCQNLAKKFKTKNFHTDERLWELNFGVWEMQTWDQITDPQARVWMDDFVNIRPPQGESFRDLQVRVMDFFNQIINSNSVDKMAIVAHAGVVRTILAHVLNIDLKHIYSLEIDYGSVNLIKHVNQRSKVQFINH